MLRIVYIGKFQPAYRTERYVAQALSEEGVSVKTIQASNRYRLDHLYRVIENHNANVVLFSKASPHWVADLIEWCRKNGIVTTAWIWDLYLGYRRERPAQFFSDILFTTDGGHDSEWKRLGVNHVLLRQGVHNQESIVFNNEIRRKVGFVGTDKSYRARKQLMIWLRRKYGNELVHHRNTRGIALNRALAKIGVVVGDTYPVKNYWSNRIYEITGRGGFLIHPKTEGLDTEFEDGIHYVSYERGMYDQISKLVLYYNAHKEEREKIRLAGWRHTKQNYTYNHRVRTLISRIQEYARANQKLGYS